MSMHIEAKIGDIAPRILLPGDPCRAEYIAENFLESPRCVNRLRGALCYTGGYKGEEISVMATGMGVPSMLIYSTELCRDYGCEKLIRIGTSAGYRLDMEKHDIVLAQATCTTSAINYHIFNGTFAPIADFEMLQKAYNIACNSNLKIYVGNTICNDRIYRDQGDYMAQKWIDYGVLCSEMEGAALYTAAAQFQRQALMMVSIVSKLIVEEGIEKPVPFNGSGNNTMDDMLILALETLIC